MSVNTAIHKGVKAAFRILKSLQHKATYTHEISNDGFEDKEVTTHPITVIMDSFSERDVQFLSFSNEIQPQDVRGLVRGLELPINPSTKDTLKIEDTSIFGGDNPWSVIAWDVDPAVAMFTFLLRRT